MVKPLLCILCCLHCIGLFSQTTHSDSEFRKGSLKGAKNWSETKEAFYEVLRSGNFKRYDSLVPIYEDFASQYETSDATKHVSALLYQARMLTIRKRMNEAYRKLEDAKKAYANHRLDITEHEQAFRYLTAYLDLQINRRYDFEGMQSALDYIRNSSPTDDHILAFMEETVGRMQIDYTNYEEALGHFKAAGRIYEKKGYTPYRAQTANLLGVAFDGLENLDSVLHYNKMAIDLYKASDVPSYNGLASTSYNLGLLYQERLANTHQAEKFYQEAIAYDSESGGITNPYLCVDYRALAEVYLAKNDIRKALLYAEKAVHQGETYFGLNDSRTAQAILVLSDVYLAKGNTQEALLQAERAFDMIKTIVGNKSHRWVVMAYNRIAHIRKEEGKTDEAIDLFKRAVQISKDIDRHLYLAEAYKNLVDLYEENARFETALTYSDSLKSILNVRFKNATYRHWRHQLQELKLRQSLNDTVGITSEIKQLKGQLPNKNLDPNIWISMLGVELQSMSQNGLQYSELKGQLNELLKFIAVTRNTFSNQENRIFYNKSIQAIVAQSLDAAYRAYQLSQDESFLDMCYAFMELNKNSALLEGVQNIRFKQIANVPEPLIAQEQEITEQLQDTRSSIIYLRNKKGVDSRIMEQLNDKLLTLDNKLDSINASIVKNYPKYNQLKNLNISTGYNEFIREHLPQNKAIMQYFLGQDAWYRMVLSNQQVNIEKFDTQDELRRLVKELRSAIQAQRPYNSTIEKLSEILLPKNIPAEVESLGIVSDDVLNFVPFEILRNDGDLLIENYAISYLGSVQLFRQQVKLTNTKGKKWSGYAPSYLEESLPNNQREVEQISAITQGSVFLGDQATKSNFMQTYDNTDLLHLALHSELDNVNPLNNRLLFTTNEGSNDSNSLSAVEIYSLDLNSHMVVLSSCNTGFGKIAKGEGVMNMSRAFTYAGVSSTVMSLWKVPDKETSQIMTSFYKYLKEGDPKDTALQKAKLDYLANTDDELLKHPLYWAGFIVSGDTAPITNSNYWIWIFSITVLLLVVVIFRKNLIKFFQK